MSQSRFSIVLVGVSALLRRPLVSRLRPAGFTARGSGGFRRSGRPSVSEITAGRVGLRAHRFRFSAFAARRVGASARRVGASAFRFGVCRWASWPSGSRLLLFGTHRFGVALVGLAFGLTASAFRHAPLRGCPRRVGLRAHDFRFSARTASGLSSAGWFCRLPLRRCRSTGWPSGSRLPLFGMRRSAPPHRRREDRRNTPTRHLFHFKTLISTC